jgi:vitamin B12 transporter
MSRRLFVTPALLALSVTAFAQEPTTTEPVFVTATRTALTADEALASVSVITRADIERSQARSVDEVLAGVMGIDRTNSGGYGKATSLFVRGTASEHVLVLIDGLRIGSATLGSTAFEFLPLGEVERIEIVRGPRSSLYGSEAIGGVIQIFTRTGRGPLTANVEAGSGTLNTREVSAGVSGASHGTRYSVRAARFNTGGYDAQQHNAPTPYGPTTDEPDKDGYSNNSASMSVGHRFANGTDLETRFVQAKGDTEYDGFYNRTEFLQQAWNARLGISALAPWRMTWLVGTNRDDSSNYKDATFRSRIDTRRRLATWQNDFTLGTKDLLTAGVDYQDDQVISSNDYTRSSRDNIGTFAQYQTGFGAADVQLAARHDNNESSGHYNTGSLALGYRLTAALRGYGSYATGYKAPTFNALYWPTQSDSYFGTTYVTRGNPALVPEESETRELGLQYQLASHTHTRAAIYRTEISNLIQWETTQTAANTYTTMPTNLARAEIEGAELGLEHQHGANRVRAQYSWVDPRDPATGKLLLRRAQNTWRLDGARRFGPAELGGEWLVQSYRFDDSANQVRLGGYGLLNLNARYDFDKDWSLRAKLGNALDKVYETANTYNMPRRSFFVSLGYSAQP